ncbi:serine/threonine protein phosphatase [Pseudomonas sp. Seg1]|nr:3',5'-cyclic adenosine monophosphate phosphodiesterase CpdA [Pseudomonas marginalis]BBP70814.1 serine/threonine protein phosphatase [Pseudomonas sp. Seg1]
MLAALIDPASVNLPLNPQGQRLRIRIYSDLHAEFHRFAPPSLDAGVDLVILAGDINKKARGVQWANDTFACHVAYIAGNHEYYDGHIDRTLQKMKGAAAGHVHVLENEALILGDVRILGTTAWTDYSVTGDLLAASNAARQGMNDFKYIRADSNYRRLRLDDLVTRNHIARDWLTQELARPFDGKTVVVTHHSPSPVVIGEQHDGHLTAAYTNDWPRLIEKAHVWVFGHTHEATDVELAGCRVVSNPGGYPGESTGFDPYFEIQI